MPKMAKNDLFFKKMGPGQVTFGPGTLDLPPQVTNLALLPPIEGLEI